MVSSDRLQIVMMALIMTIEFFYSVQCFEREVNKNKSKNMNQFLNFYD